MNKTLITLACAAACATAYGQEPYKVIAPLSGVEEGDTAYLVNYDNGEVVDSAVVFDHNAVFRGSIDEPILVRLYANKNRQGNLILEPGTVAFSPKKRVGVGTMLNDAYNAYNDSIGAFQQMYDEAKDSDARKAVEARMAEYTRSVLLENNDNPIGLGVALDLFFQMDKDEFEQLIKEKTDLRKYARVEKMLSTIATIKATSAGAKMIDFEVAYGDSIQRLSDYVGKGKYVLVDFWASWCGPCMREIRNLKEIYKKYAGNDKFEILGVAVWDEPQKSEEAIKRVQIPWPCILNAQTIPTDIYGITGIPCLILFAPDGTIALRDVYGDELKEKLREILK